MENLFNHPFVQKMQEVGQKLGSNTFVASLQAAMMSTMAIIMVGAISMILCNVGNENVLGLFQTGDAVWSTLFLPYRFTMNMLSLWVVTLVGFYYARNLKMQTPIMSGINSALCFLLISGALGANEAGVTVMDVTYLSSQGMFVAFIVAFIAVHVDKICADKNIYIHMPDTVPSFLQASFAAIVPLVIDMVLFVGISTTISVATGGAYNMCSGIVALLSAPLSALASVPGMFILCTLCVVLWCFGIHGTAICTTVTTPLSLQALAANAAAAAAGEPIVFYPIFLWSFVACAGGTGNTFPLALMGLRSKSKQIRAVARASAIPGWFNINEPVTFGYPIMYNPILCIPYVLNVPIVLLVAYLGFQSGLLTPLWISFRGLMPIGFGSYLCTLSPINFLWDYLCGFVAGLVYYPFFKIYEKKLIEEEKQAELAETEQAAAPATE